MALVWLLILRGIAIEFRNQIQNAAWERLWDVVFSASSTLVVISFGAALGNRGPRRAPR
jgi:cytochrome bd ubiquinol oxidase subunit II